MYKSSSIFSQYDVDLKQTSVSKKEKKMNKK